MRKLITSVLIASTLIATPALARGDHGRDRNHRSERNERHGGGWVAPLLGGIILGAIIADSDRDERRDRYEDRRYRPYDPYAEDRRYRPYDPYAEDRYSMPPRAQYYEHYCVTEQITDRYGTYFRKTCQ
jgi:hypothetical protein